jgi:hypothetical protein
MINHWPVILSDGVDFGWSWLIIGLQQIINPRFHFLFSHIWLNKCILFGIFRCYFLGQLFIMAYISFMSASYLEYKKKQNWFHKINKCFFGFTLLVYYCIIILVISWEEGTSVVMWNAIYKAFLNIERCFMLEIPFKLWKDTWNFNLPLFFSISCMFSLVSKFFFATGVWWFNFEIQIDVQFWNTRISSDIWTDQII